MLDAASQILLELPTINTRSTTVVARGAAAKSVRNKGIAQFREKKLTKTEQDQNKTAARLRYILTSKSH